MLQPALSTSEFASSQGQSTWPCVSISNRKPASCKSAFKVSFKCLLCRNAKRLLPSFKHNDSVKIRFLGEKEGKFSRTVTHICCGASSSFSFLQMSLCHCVTQVVHHPFRLTAIRLCARQACVLSYPMPHVLSSKTIKSCRRKPGSEQT